MVRAVTGATHAVSSLYRHAMVHPGRCQMSVGPDKTFGPGYIIITPHIIKLGANAT